MQCRDIINLKNLADVGTNHLYAFALDNLNDSALIVAEKDM